MGGGTRGCPLVMPSSFAVPAPPGTSGRQIRLVHAARPRCCVRSAAAPPPLARASHPIVGIRSCGWSLIGRVARLAAAPPIGPLWLFGAPMRTPPATTPPTATDVSRSMVWRLDGGLRACSAVYDRQVRGGAACGASSSTVLQPIANFRKIGVLVVGRIGLDTSEPIGSVWFNSLKLLRSRASASEAAFRNDAREPPAESAETLGPSGRLL